MHVTWLRVDFLLSISFLPYSYTRASWADCSKAEKDGWDLLLIAKMMELFESFFFTHFGARPRCLEPSLIYEKLLPWILAPFCTSTILIKFPYRLCNNAVKFVYKY